jgi:hypothetical protein
MKMNFTLAVCSAMIGALVLSSPAAAQQKTVKACQQEWQANKAANQAAGITQKAYVEKCRASSAAAQPTTKPAAKITAKPAQAPAKPAAEKSESPQKTVRACQEEWRANRAANEAAGITQKSYVEKCRAGATTAQPAPAAVPAPAPARPAAKTTAPAPERPAARTPAPAAPAAPPPAITRAPAAGTPTAAGQFATEAEAKARCPRDTVVWANLDSKIYHFAGYKDYGNTKSGAYMCEGTTAAGGFRAAKNEKHP